MGVIKLNDMSFFAYHGVSEAEKKVGKNFNISLEMEYDMSEAVKDDDLSCTVNYEDVYKTIKQFVTEKKFHLIETLSERLADRLFEKYDINRLKLSVGKVTPPFPGSVESIEVLITRGKSE